MKQLFMPNIQKNTTVGTLDFKDFKDSNEIHGEEFTINGFYESVCLLSLDKKMQHTILHKELDTVEENLEVLRSQGRDVSHAMIKGLEKRKANLEVKLDGIAYAIKERTDDVVDFKQMGIDHLFIDESHKFKNLMFNTRHDRVAGLGSQDGSQKALNLLFAIRTIQDRTKQVKTWVLLFFPERLFQIL